MQKPIYIQSVKPFIISKEVWRVNDVIFFISQIIIESLVSVNYFQNRLLLKAGIEKIHFISYEYFQLFFPNNVILYWKLNLESTQIVSLL